MELKQKVRFCTPDRPVTSLVIQERKIPVYTVAATDEGPEELPGLETQPRLVDDPILRGEYRIEADLYVPPVEVIVELANCRRDARAVQRFTRRYGSLLTQSDGTFAFPLSLWCDMQGQFRCAWDGLLGLDSRYPAVMMAPLKERAPHLFDQPMRRAQAAGHFELTSAGLDFVGETLYSTLLLVMFAVHEQKKLRHCANPRCEEPYFIASHPRQQYCTEKCAEWAQSEAKKAWWKEKGKDWLKHKADKGSRKTRRLSSKEAPSHGTRKAR